MRRMDGGVRAGLAASALCGGLMLGASTPAPAPIPPELAWAYPAPPPNPSPLKLPPGAYRTPDGKRTLSVEDMHKLELPDQDWFPQSHPEPPAVVQSVAKEDAPLPCAECHTVTGQGNLGIPDLAGLRQGYLMEQVEAFRSGTRTPSTPRYVAALHMIEAAKGWGENDLKAATAYFASLPRHTAIRVVESDVAPAMKTHRYAWTYVDPESGAPRPLDGAVAEAPENLVGVYMGDLSTRQIVYAPKGSIARGRAVALHAGGGAQPCAVCHGDGYKGTEVAPPLAGRDPSYLARQLWDVRSGARSGPSVELMQAQVKGLSAAQMRDVAVYMASLKP